MKRILNRILITIDEIKNTEVPTVVFSIEMQDKEGNSFNIYKDLRILVGGTFQMLFGEEKEESSDSLPPLKVNVTDVVGMTDKFG